jgi:hypothetical protein
MYLDYLRILTKKNILLNWNILIFIISVTLALWIFVVITSFAVTRGGLWSLSLSLSLIVLSILAWRSWNRRRDILWRLQGRETVVFKHRGSYFDLVLTLLISGTFFTLFGYYFEVYWGIPLFFSVPWIAFGLMMTLTKNLTSHELVGNLLLIRLGFIEIVIPLLNISSIKRTQELLMADPRKLKQLPRQYRATTSYFGNRLVIGLKEPQRILMVGLPPIKKSSEILIDVDLPNKFLREVKSRIAQAKMDKDRFDRNFLLI